MTREEAVKIIEERIRIDREGILNGGEPESDFDKFIAKQDEALEIALQMLKNPVDFLDSIELTVAYLKRQNLCDIYDIKMRIDADSEWYAGRFGIDYNPVTEKELKNMADQLRKILDCDADAVRSSCCNEAIECVLSERSK